MCNQNRVSCEALRNLLNNTANSTIEIDQTAEEILRDDILEKACLTNASDQEAPTVNDYNSEADFLSNFMKVSNLLGSHIK